MKRRQISLSIAILLLAMLALVLAGCGDQDDEQPGEPTATAVAEATDEPEVETPAVAAVVEPTAEPEGEAEGVEEPSPTPEPIAFDNLHVPSPDWSEQVIYFMMTDRFNDGDPSNNDFGAGEYAPDFHKYNGGDLQGIIDQLDYIQGLGATAIWITPPVSNQWWDPVIEFGGYHGYWAENFKALDPHVGTLEAYQALSDALHDRGMYLIQDIVANHTGNFFTYRSASGLTKYDPADPAADVNFNLESVPVTKPSQPPFDMNDVTDPAQKEAAIYHWTPTIEDQSNDEQRVSYQLSDLDDLNTENPVVREALRDSFGYWIETVGVDGFRIDTVKHVDHEFWNDFIHSEDPDTPGMDLVAASTGRDDFITFGEALDGSAPYETIGEQKVASYLGTDDAPELSSMLNYPLYFTLSRIFAEGQPTNEMVHRLNASQDPTYFPDPYTIPIFIDNHDQPRFLAKGNVAGLKQANMFIMTIPGIPILYYGTEQGFDQTRAAMFAEGWESGGQDNFDQESELYQFIRAMADLRKSSPLFTKGTLTTLGGNDSGPGALAYRRDHEGETAVIIFNTSDRPVLMTKMDMQLPEGTILNVLFGLANEEDLVVGREGKMTMELAPREGMVLLVSDDVVPLEGGEGTITIDTDLSAQIYTDDFEIAGTVSEPGVQVKVIGNGNLAQAIDTTADDNGNFTVVVPISIFPPGQSQITVSAYAPELQAVSDNYTLTAEVTSTDARVSVFDLDGDDVGPLYTYSYPTDDTFSEQMDIHSVTASAYGSNLVVDVEMAEITDVWDPANGFDHVAFHIFIDLPGSDGLTTMPRLNAETPDGFAWDYMAFAEGWGTRLFSKEGADAQSQGTAVTPAPFIVTDKESNTVSFLFLADALGNPLSLEGTQVYVTTWDWNGIDAVLRPLRPAAAQWAFGGGDGAVDPIFIDDTDPLPVALDTRIIAFDPVGDDDGPYDPAIAAGRYSKPSDASFGGQMDLTQTSLILSEDGLKLVLEMGEVSNSLGAPNGFDRVRFHVFLDLPGQEGTNILPFLNAEAPEGLAWDYAAAVDGWNNNLYTAAGAAVDAYGAPGSSGPEITVDQEAGTIDLFFPAGALGSPATLEGTKAYITTWDWDDEAETMRALTPEGGPVEFGDGDGSVDPLILDAVIVGQVAAYLSPIPPTPQVEVLLLVRAPDGSPPGDDLFLTGEFNTWNPADPQYRFTNNGDGTYSLVLLLDEGTVMEYRITRGSFANAEKLDPEDRFANRTLEVPLDATGYQEEIIVEGWWDD